MAGITRDAGNTLATRVPKTGGRRPVEKRPPAPLKPKPRRGRRK